MSAAPKDTLGTDLCSGCGLCCDGSLYDYVTVAPDELERACAAGLPVVELGDEHAVVEPCPAHRGTGCSIYADRPAQCRAYRCGLLRALDEGATSLADARSVVGEVRELAAAIRARVGAPELGLRRAVEAHEAQAGDAARTIAWRLRNAALFVDVEQLASVIRARIEPKFRS